MKARNLTQWIARAALLGLTLACAAPSRADVIVISGIVVFGTPEFVGDVVEVPLILTQPIDDAISGSIVLQAGSPTPSDVIIPHDYTGIITMPIPGRRDLLAIDFVDPVVLQPGELVRWRFDPAPEGSTLTLNTSFSYVETFSFTTFNEDRYPFEASVEIHKTVVPEPTSVLLLLAGLTLTAARLKRADRS